VKPHVISLLAGALLAVAALGFLAVSWLGIGADDPQSRGRQLAERMCAGCHALAPGQASPVPQAPSLTRISERYPVDSLAESLAEGVVTGHNGMRMPEFQLTTDQINDLLAYLGSIQAR